MITEIQNFLTSCNHGPRQFGQTAFDYNKISVANTKVILMAIFKIKGNKRLEVEMPDDFTSKNQSKKLEFGWMNEQNQLCLPKPDILKMQQKYSQINFNRINFNSNKKKDAPKSENFSFKPDL